MKAYAADSLVESMGANVHLHYDSKDAAGNLNAYGDFEKKVVPALEYLGIRHVRDTFPAYKATHKDSFYYQRVRALAAKGIKFDMTISRAFQNNPETDMARLSDYVAWTGGAVASIEGVNEPDDDPATARRLQEALYKAVKAQKLGIPVLAPSMIGNNAGLGDVGQWCDYGNMHSYAGSGKPSGPLDNDVKTKSVCWPGKQPFVTECGYQNATKHTGGHKPIDEASAGIYAAILFLEGFRRGFPRSFWYELLNQYPDPGLTQKEWNFGLFRYDGSPKPAAVAIRRLLNLHFDLGKSFTPKDLDLSVKGPDTTRSLLFQHSDGSYRLDLWRDVEASAKPVEVTVKLPKPIAGYKLHPFGSETIGFTSGKEGSRQVIDITTTLDKTTLEPLYAKRSERTEVVGTGGSDTITVLLGAGLSVVEFNA